jgi:hypothetical protein
VLAPDGAGIEAVYAHIGRRGRRHACHSAIRQARRIANPVTREEMLRIADLWIDSALTLTEADLRKMTRLAAAQDRQRNRGACGDLSRGPPPARNCISTVTPGDHQLLDRLRDQGGGAALPRTLLVRRDAVRRGARRAKCVQIIAHAATVSRRLR